MKRPLVRRRRGFTLIEVLLVLVILVILAATAVPLYSSYQKQANKNAAKSQIGMMETALDGYQLNVGDYPVTLDGLLAPPADLPNPAKWEGPYLKGNAIPLDPWGNQYQYKAPGDHNQTTYDLWTVSPDGVEIGNWQM